MEEQSVTPPTHGGKGRPVTHALPPDTVQAVKAFIKSYANLWGMPQPAAPRGRAQIAPVYLPASSKKKEVFKLYSETEGATPMAYCTFVKQWNEHCPEVVVMKPRSDVCTWCAKLRYAFRKAKTEEAIKVAAANLAQHLKQADKERQYCRAKIEEAKGHVQEQQDPEMVHITFDFAQQLEVPQHTRQVGPIYFKSRFKVQLFGVCNEAANKQLNFLFHEGECIGIDGKKAHGPNAIVSMLYHFLQESCSAPTIAMHADNCVRQNKNRTVMAFICWYVMLGHADDVQLLFMRVGHTRCSVDAKFGRLKQQYRSSEVDNMDDIVAAVDSSCAANDALRYSWAWRPWDTFLAEYFLPIRGIRRYQHFRATKAKPGVLLLKESCDDEEKELVLLRPSKTVSDVTAAGLPAALTTAGMSEQRLEYLEAQIKPYLAEDKLPPWATS